MARNPDASVECSRFSIPHVGSLEWSWPEARRGSEVGTVIGLGITLTIIALEPQSIIYLRLPFRSLSDLGINLGITAAHAIFAAAVGAAVKGNVGSDQEIQR